MSLWKISQTDHGNFIARCDELKQTSYGETLTEVKEASAEICRFLREDGVRASDPEFEHLTRNEARAELDKQYAVR